MKLITILILLLLLTLPAQAKVTVLGEIFRPFSYEEDGQKKGMVTEIVDLLLKDAKIEPDRWIISPWKYVYKHAVDMEDALLYTVVRNPEREKLFHWIGPLSDRNFCLYKLKSRKDIKVESWEDVKKYTVASLEDGAGTKQIESHGVKIYKTRDLKQAYKMLVNGRSDLYATLDYSLYFFKRTEKSNLKFEKVWTVNNTTQYFIALNSKMNKDTVQKIKKTFSKLKKSGEINKIIKKYLK
jgi:polar amino acid transport system substrate-binding protein